MSTETSIPEPTAHGTTTHGLCSHIPPVRVLIVEDRPVARKLIEDEIGSDAGLQVAATARDGDEAVAMVRRLQPDVVLMDVVMPGKDGIQTLAEIRTFSAVPVILLTGAQIATDALEHVARRLGADGFFLKPSGSISLDLHTIRHELISAIHTLARDARDRTGALPATMGPVGHRVVPASPRRVTNA